MILIFDLDDTLYDEMKFVESGFRTVAKWLSQQCDLNEDEINKNLIFVLVTEGRGKVFDQVLKIHGLYNKKLVNQCLRIYRQHYPEIKLFSGAKKLLQDLKLPKYIVTDGHKIVQYNKIKALGVEPLVKKVFITHRYGIKHAKPSIFCFEKIKNLEKCKFNDMVYIGDNPAKDFVNLNKIGVRTVRVLTGNYKDAKAEKGYEAEITIPTIDNFTLQLLS